MSTPALTAASETLAETEPQGPSSARRRADERLDLVSAIPFLLVHLTPLLVLVTGVSWRAVVLLAVTFFGRQFCITGGYHRYFAHRSYRLARVPQFLLAFAGTTAAQKGPLWWAGHHRNHHRFADTDRDLHSPRRGFWWSHVGWILCDRYGSTDTDAIADFAKYPELRFLDRNDWIGPWTLAVVCLLVGGWQGLVVGFFVSTVLLWHATFAINSLAHVFGRRRYATSDTSRNSAVLAVLTAGEGWHNNHHHWPSSARNGFRWWQWDPTFYLLRVAAVLHITHDLKQVPHAALMKNRVRDGHFDVGVFQASWNRAARTVAAAGADLDTFARDRATAVHDTRASLAAGLEQRRRALQDAMATALDAAEQLARARRAADRHPPAEVH